jgi:hypothetical protein
MVNKQKYSSAIASARKNYFNQLFEYWNFKDLKNRARQISSGKNNLFKSGLRIQAFIVKKC